MVFNDTEVMVNLMLDRFAVNVSVSVADSDYYNITLTANTDCVTINTTESSTSGEMSVTELYIIVEPR